MKRLLLLLLPFFLVASVSALYSPTGLINHISFDADFTDANHTMVPTVNGDAQITHNSLIGPGASHFAGTGYVEYDDYRHSN